MEQESIYNIIPRNPELSPSKPIYKSKYPYDIPPTGSTFAIHTSSKPGVTELISKISNLSGDFSVGLEGHSPRGMAQTFGHVRGNRKSLPNSFQKKHTGTMGNNQLPPSKYCKILSSQFLI